jgi:hypothetical protein
MVLLFEKLFGVFSNYIVYVDERLLYKFMTNEWEIFSIEKILYLISFSKRKIIILLMGEFIFLIFVSSKR